MWAAVVDPLTALVMLLTLPLVPIFMWLIGRYSEDRARKRWQALRLLSTHFLDVVRGLPTLRAYNRGRAQAAVIEQVGDRYRRATMGTLRVAFLSGSVLELASTLGVALVAVTVGVRLDEGGIGFQAALTVLLLAPELYAPLRQLGTQFHASADGRAVAERLLALGQRARGARGRHRCAAEPARSPVRLESLSSPTPRAPEGCSTGSTSSSLTRRDGGAGRPERRRQEHRREPAAAPGRARRRARHGRRRRPRRVRHRGVAAARGLGPQRPMIFRGTVSENIALGDPDASAERVRGQPCSPAPTALSGACGRATLPRSGTAGGPSRRRAPAARPGAGVPARRAARRARRADRRPRPRAAR